MHLIFLGDPQELQRGGAISRQSIEIEGVLFRMGEVVDASGLSPRMRSKLANNPHFKVVEEAASAVSAEADSSAAPAPASRRGKSKED